MSKGYTIAHGRFGKYYSVDQSLVRYPCASLKSNKIAAGMAYTRARKGSKQGEGSRDGLTLAVYGTLDPLARINRMRAYRHQYYRQITIWQKKIA